MSVRTVAAALVVGAGLACAVGPGALAEQAAQTAARTRQPERADKAVREATAVRLARLAVVYLRLVGDPRPFDFELAAMLLERALELMPGDEELLRRLIEARHAIGDDDGVFRATEELLRIAPDDTVAQLRLITMRVGRMQDAPSRMALYDRMLGPAGSALHATVRSRLALDDAMLAREIGDEERFVRRLSQAIQLDPTNKEAALLAASFGMEGTTDPLARVELRANIVFADPLDIGAHMALARELMMHGAFNGAARFYSRTAELYAQNQEPGDDPLIIEAFCAYWGAFGPDRELDRLHEDEKVALFYWRKRQEQLAEAGDDPSKAEPVKVNPSIEAARAYCAYSVGRDEDTRSAVNRVSLHVQASLKALAQAIANGEVDEEQAQVAVRLLRSERLWLRLFTGEEVAEARADFDAIKDSLDPEARQRFEGFLALRNDSLADAVRLLTPLAENDARARAGLAIAAELSGDRTRAAAEYARLIIAYPGALPFPAPPLGLWARGRLQRLLGEPVRPTETQRAVDDYAMRLPTSIEEMTRSAANFMHLQLDLAQDAVGPLDRSMVRVRLTNIGKIPLAVGPSAPLNSVLLLSPTLTTQTTSRMADLEPEVASLDRRLALAPGESLIATVWADQGKVGEILDGTCNGASSLRWTGVQGFKLLSGNEFEQGPMCLVAETGVQTRRPAADPAATLPVVIEKLRTARGAELLEWILLARNMAMTPAPAPATDDERALAAQPDGATPFWRRDPIARTLAERLPEMSELEAAFTLLQLPAARALARPLLEMQPLDAAARADARPLVRMVTLLTRAPSSEDELYDQTIAGDDPELARYARLLRERRVTDARDRLRLEQPRTPALPASPENNDPWGAASAPATGSSRPPQ